jgi:hypothetical protein
MERSREFEMLWRIRNPDLRAGSRKEQEMDRQKAVRRVAAAGVVGVVATVLALGSASPALAKDGECEEYRAMARHSYAGYFDLMADPWSWMGEDLLLAAGLRTAGEHFTAQAADACG